MSRQEALHAGLDKTAASLLEAIAQHRDSQGSALVSEWSQTRESDKDPATGLRPTSEKIPVHTTRNTQQQNPRKYSGRTHTASASGSGDPYRPTLASNSSSAEGLATQSERFALSHANVSGSESKASALGLRPGQPKQFTPREEGAGISSPASLTPEGSQLLASTLATLGLDHSKASATEVIAALFTSLQSKTSSGAELARSEQLSSGAEVESQIQAFCHESSRVGGSLTSAEVTPVGPAIAPGTSTTVKPQQQQQHDAYDRIMFSGPEAPNATVGTDCDKSISDSNRDFPFIRSKPVNKTKLATAVLDSARAANNGYFSPPTSVIKSDETELMEHGPDAGIFLAQNILNTTDTQHEKEGSGSAKTALAKPIQNVIDEDNNSNQCPSAKVQADASVTGSAQMTVSPPITEGTQSAFSKGENNLEGRTPGSNYKAHDLLKTIEKILSQQEGIMFNHEQVEQLEESLGTDSSRAGHTTHEDQSEPCSSSAKIAPSPSLGELIGSNSQVKSRMNLAELAESEEEKQVAELKSAPEGVVSTLGGGNSKRTHISAGLEIWRVVKIMNQLALGQLDTLLEPVQGSPGPR